MKQPPKDLFEGNSEERDVMILTFAGKLLSRYNLTCKKGVKNFLALRFFS